MQKLLDTFRAAPTAANRAKLDTHMSKHPFASCLLAIDEIAFLRANGFSV